MIDKEILATRRVKQYTTYYPKLRRTASHPTLPQTMRKLHCRCTVLHSCQQGSSYATSDVESGAKVTLGQRACHALEQLAGAGTGRSNVPSSPLAHSLQTLLPSTPPFCVQTRPFPQGAMEDLNHVNGSTAEERVEIAIKKDKARDYC